MQLKDYIYAQSPYRGSEESSEMKFDVILQEFATRVNYICALESGGKLSGSDAYQEIKNIWKELKSRRKLIRMQEVQGPDLFGD